MMAVVKSCVLIGDVYCAIWLGKFNEVQNKATLCFTSVGELRYRVEGSVFYKEGYLMRRKYHCR